jgi:hypothetical protein
MAWCTPRPGIATPGERKYGLRCECQRPWPAAWAEVAPIAITSKQQKAAASHSRRDVHNPA